MYTVIAAKLLGPKRDRTREIIETLARPINLLSLSPIGGLTNVSYKQLDYKVMM